MPQFALRHVAPLPQHHHHDILRVGQLQRLQRLAVLADDLFRTGVQRKAQLIVQTDAPVFLRVFQINLSLCGGTGISDSAIKVCRFCAFACLRFPICSGRAMQRSLPASGRPSPCQPLHVPAPPSGDASWRIALYPGPLKMKPSLIRPAARSGSSPSQSPASGSGAAAPS